MFVCMYIHIYIYIYIYIKELATYCGWPAPPPPRRRRPWACSRRPACAPASRDNRQYDERYII